MSKKEIEFIPYLHFPGSCEEALNFYEKILEGKVEILQRYDNPLMKTPDNYKNKVLHARFRFADYEIYASDVFPGESVNLENSNIALSLTLIDLEKATHVFARLAKDGNIGVLFQRQFWGAWHGKLVDRFGIHWMVNVV